MLIDTHAHVNFNAYKNNAEEVIHRSLENDVWLINVGTKYETSKRAVEIAQKYEKGVYAAIGLHPIHLLAKVKIDPEEIESSAREEEFDYEKYKKIAQNSKVVAIGEIGLDYYYKPKTKRKLELFKEKQKEVLEKQLKLAKELNLPVIFHCRMAHHDLIQTIKQFNNFTIKGVIHCFTGNWEQAEKYLEMGFYLGFNGLIFKMEVAETPSHLPPRATSSHSVFDEIIRKTPLEKILIETDCPYLTPPPMEGRNEPIYVRYVAEKIAKVKKLNYEKIARITTENAKRLFNLKKEKF